MILVLLFGFINIYSTCYVLSPLISDIEDESIHTVQNLVSSMKTTVPIFLRLNLSLECSSILTMALLCLRLDKICIFILFSLSIMVFSYDHLLILNLFWIKGGKHFTKCVTEQVKQKLPSLPGILSII